MTTLLRRAVAVAAPLLALMLPQATADAYVLGGRAWPGPTIRYYAVPFRYEHAVDRAAEAWNRAGVGITFVRANGPSDARVRVTVRGGGCEGDSSLGFDGWHRAATVDMGQGCGGGLLTLTVVHELGHVLGLDHETRRCARMNPLSHHDGTPLQCSRHKMRFWLAHPLTRDDIRGARALYARRR